MRHYLYGSHWEGSIKIYNAGDVVSYKGIQLRFLGDIYKDYKSALIVPHTPQDEVLMRLGGDPLVGNSAMCVWKMEEDTDMYLVSLDVLLEGIE